MIVVAIIALLAAIAVPNFLRARKRSQATRVLEDLRMIDGAKDQYAIENNKAGVDIPTAEDLVDYIKNGTPLYNAAVAAAAGTTIDDAIGNPIALGDIDTLPQIDAATHTNFSDVVEDEFWLSYYAAPAP
jgi:type II secretory pathway pseudopilin PulG